MVSDSKCETGFSQSVRKFDKTLDRCYTKPDVSYEGRISPDMLCASPTFGSNSSGTCQGDSGGPFTIKNNSGQHELVGITSWGEGCAEVRF